MLPEIRRFSERSGVLQGDEHLGRLGESLCGAKDINTFCLSKGISSKILASNYGTELKLAAIRKAATLTNAPLLQQVLNWSFSGASGTPIGDYYEAMLSPFELKAPPPDVQKLLMSTLVIKFDDPRISDWPGLKGADGEARRSSCVATIRRWLSIEYLDLFIRIIEDY